tara:strand:+ start:60 stop:734 length:675 start_codon:yes stop_codon:yes gene_type:complete
VKIVKLFHIFALLLCTYSSVAANDKKDKIAGQKNFLHSYEAFNKDQTINVVIEIPAGSNEKWEVSKVDGTLRWNFSNNSYQVIKYLPYVANYGFIPQTIYPKKLGGDGDPIDVVLLGKKIKRGKVIKSKILGIMLMTDDGEQDDKIIAIPYDGKIFPQNNLENLEDLKKNYPGVLKIIETWFYNYKRSGQVEIHGYDTKYKAIEIIKASQKPYETLRGYWLQNN